MFRPPVEKSGTATRVRLVFLDGTTATLTYPAALRLTKDGAWPDTTGGEPGRQVRPEIWYRAVQLQVSDRPVQCVRARDGSLAGVWPHPDGDVLILRFGPWFVSVFENYTNVEAWARHLRGRVTHDGWLVLRGDRHLKVGPAQEYGDTSIRLGDLEPGVILWPLRCRSDEERPKDVASGRKVEKVGRHEFFASWCDRDASMEVHVYSRTAAFIRRAARSLEISDVRRAHPDAALSHRALAALMEIDRDGHDSLNGESIGYVRVCDLFESATSSGCSLAITYEVFADGAAARHQLRAFTRKNRGAVHTTINDWDVYRLKASPYPTFCVRTWTKDTWCDTVVQNVFVEARSLAALFRLSSRSHIGDVVMSAIRHAKSVSS